MQKNGAILTFFCLAAMVLLLGLQGYWIGNYYTLTRNNFEREVNLAFEDALKKEFSSRADSISAVLKSKLMDTTLFEISASINPKYKNVVYKVRSTKDTNDKYSTNFSFRDLDVLINPQNKKAMVNKITDKFVQMLRNEDLENHMIYYRTQQLGRFMVESTQKIEFDTANLRPVLKKYLAERNINVPYAFYTKDQDSTTNKSTFDPALLRAYPVITRSLPTYRYSPGQNYVRVMFKDPFLYIMSNMWLLLSCSVLLTGFIGLCLNFLLRTLNREKKLSTIKNDFISNITHEFKTPISTALVAIEALNDKTVIIDEEKTKRYLGHAKNELNRIGSLTDKILKLSLYDTGNYEIRKEEIDVNDIINELISVYSISEKVIKITFENRAGNVPVIADKTQFQHAVSNILENAIKYGGDPVEVMISCYIANGFFITSVKDNGPGIATSELPLIFEKFYRIPQSGGTQIKGHGLGLNYVRKIMDQHAGWYSATSDSKGTEMQLGWPI